MSAQDEICDRQSVMIHSEHHRREQDDIAQSVDKETDLPVGIVDGSTEKRLDKLEQSPAVVLLDAKERLARHHESEIAIGNSEEDDSFDSSSVETSPSDAEIENAPLDQITGNGWFMDPLTIEGQENGISLKDNQPSIYGDISIVNSTAHIGPRNFIKGNNVFIKYVNNNASSTSEENAITEASDVQNKNLPNGVKSANGSNEGPKHSTGSDHPFIPIQRSKLAEWCATRRCAITICTMAVILVTLVILAVWLAKLLGTEFSTELPHVPVQPNDTSINNEPTIPGVKIIPRIEWGAQPPERPADPLTVKPPPYVIISHTATMFCYTQAQCVLIVRTAQTLHIESKGWDDIGYNFLVGGDGNVYQGRGWGVEGAHTFNYNRKSIGISFIGTFNSVEPTKAQLHAAKKLIEEGVEAGEISKDYKLLGHRQCTKTESPGEVLYNIIKTWDHWSPTP